jgi:hypothetical protein
MNPVLRWSTLFAMAACLIPAAAGESGAPAEPAKLHFEPRFILETVAKRLGVTLRPEIPVPAIFVASTTPLAQFQDAIETQWRFRPDVVLNTYAIARNEIYLYDGAAYYAQHNRTLDDSLAHEFVHYLQAQYRNDDLSSEWREAEAVDIQTWFRKVHVGRDTVARQSRSPASTDPLCSVTPTDAGARAIRCPAGPRPAPG